MAQESNRKFEVEEAVRQHVPLMIGLMGPSGGGKTYSALRLAKGIQSVVGGDIVGIDTEGRRMLHYADRFQFRHMHFPAPYASLDYLAAMRQAVKAGGRVIVVDSMSHEHEGPGGMIDFQDRELDRLTQGNAGRRDAMKMLAWAAPKAARRALINGLLQIEGAHFIFCFRAKESAKPVKGANGRTEVIHQGFVPIAGDEFVFEMTMNALLLPNAGGVPTWQSENPGERMMIKLPAQFRSLLNANPPPPIDEELGANLAKWAVGGAARPAPRPEELERQRQDEERASRPAETQEEREAREERRPPAEDPPAAEEPAGEQPPPSTSDEPPAETPEARLRREALEERQACNAAFDDGKAHGLADRTGQELPADWSPARVASYRDGLKEGLEERAKADPFALFAASLAASKAWLDVREAYVSLLKAPAWKEAGAERQQRSRALAWGRQEELNRSGDKAASFDMLNDAHAFRCFVDWVTDVDALTGTFDTFKRQAAWVGLNAAAQQALSSAVSARGALLATSQNEASEFQ